jgi:hypothetical protein
MGNSKQIQHMVIIKADVGKEILYLAKDLLRLHVTLAKDVQNDIYLISFKHQVNMFSPRYDFLNKREWLFVYKLELNLLELLEIITKDENNRMFEMLQADDDNIYIAVLSLKQFGKLREEKLESPWYIDHVKDNYFKIATPELMMFKMKNKL